MILEFSNVIINTDQIIFIAPYKNRESGDTGIRVATVTGATYKFDNNDFKDFLILEQ